MKNIYNIDSDDVWWSASDIGWIVGHSYIVYAPLFHGCTTVLFEGKPVGTPDAGVFWRIISEHKVKSLFTAPTAFRAIKKEDPKMIKRKPSTIVMKYMQDFGFKVIPVNPFAVGEVIHGETVVSDLKDVSIPIDIVDIFRPSKETPALAARAVNIETKVLWLQYGIQNEEAEKIAENSKIQYVSNKCIKQEYQRLFLKVSPVFPALRT